MSLAFTVSFVALCVLAALWINHDRVPVTDRWEDHHVVVVGGTGIHSIFLPSYGATRSVTQPIGVRDS